MPKPTTISTKSIKIAKPTNTSKNLPVQNNTSIVILGAKENNLQNIDVSIPKNSFVVLTGKSGSGKSSLAFSVIYKESFRRYAEASHFPIMLMGEPYISLMEKPQVQEITGLPFTLAVSQKQMVVGELSTVGTVLGVSDILRVFFATLGVYSCKTCDIPLQRHSASQMADAIFTKFKNKTIELRIPLALKRKGGFEKEMQRCVTAGYALFHINGLPVNAFDKLPILDAKKLNTIEVITDRLTVSHDHFTDPNETLDSNLSRNTIVNCIEHMQQWGKDSLIVYSQDAQDHMTQKEFFSLNAVCPQCQKSIETYDARYFSHTTHVGKCEECGGMGGFHQSIDMYPCGTCRGSRLTPSLTKVLWQQLSWFDIQTQNLSEIHQLLVAKKKIYTDPYLQKLLQECIQILAYACQLGLSYLSLNRSNRGLSPGELQRLRIAKVAATTLQGALYIFDEPCQGLTDAEVGQVMQVLRGLVIDYEATVLCVEHHTQCIDTADFVLEMGPGAGKYGGLVTQAKQAPFVFHHGETPVIVKNPVAKTANQITFTIHAPNRGLHNKQFFLQETGFHIWQGASGTGKKTALLHGVVPWLYSQLPVAEQKKFTEDFGELPPVLPGFHMEGVTGVKKLFFVTPGAITKNSTRNIAGLLDINTEIRKFYALLPESKVLGLTERNFAHRFTRTGLGYCPRCEGKGSLEIVHRYTGSVKRTCPLCNGTKFNSQSLIPKYKGLSIVDALNLEIQEFVPLFENLPRIVKPLELLLQFDLGYLTLNTPLSHLSGGEVQRLLLTQELHTKHLEQSWFVLVHPSTGLHTPDLYNLGSVLQNLQKKGATILIVENRNEFLPYANGVCHFTNGFD
jgi:excinuclease ABC subunit A